MNRLQLATLLSWAGDAGFEGRKRLQKVVFFLQQAGCPLDCHYTLHHFGPYSRDVADMCDELVSAGLVEESGGPQNFSVPFTYKLKPETSALLSNTSDEQMKPFQKLGKSLIEKNIWILELGSTILFYFHHCNNWDDAMKEACKFKKVEPNIEPSQEALKFAQQMVSNPFDG